ncbi:Asp-tRNA(Asn)/Glu-tRNA(Gln) amidotransferase subunit GatC [Mycoplasmoides pirum]|nr:Asp-tRNA(Asn)/Glu-tRNA(Gln) amidotransferase subunit GatC [Mycoplasmoides pirum]
MNNEIFLINNNVKNSTDISVNPAWAIGVFASLVVFILLISILKKIYVYFVHKKRYFVIPHVSVKGMTNIAMVIAMAVSLIIIIMAITGGLAGVLFRSYPGTRVSIEIILVKISGLLFGPIIGLVSGAAIDLLAVTLSAGFFHYGYFMAAMLTGLLAGSLRSVINLSKVSKRKDLILVICLTLFVIVSIIISISSFAAIPGLTEIGFVLKLPGTPIDIHLSEVQFFLLIIGTSLIVILTIWIIFIIKYFYSKNHNFNISNLTYKQYKHGNHKSSILLILKNNWYEPLVTTITLAFSVGLLVNVLFLPIFDAQITGQTYTFWVLFRFLILFVLFAIDVIVIYPILLIVTPIVKYNYQDELVEDLDILVKYETWNFKETESDMFEKEIVECSKSLLFSLSDKQLEELSKDFNEIIHSFENVSKIDTTNLEPCNYPISISIHKLREDEVNNDLNYVDIMQCPEKVENNLVKVY